MKTRKVFIVIGIIVVIALLLIAAGAVYLNRVVKTPEFKQLVLTRARDAVGAEVKIDLIDISLFSGVELRGVSVMNPEGFSGPLLTAKQFVLHYRLLPLLMRRVEIQQLTLQQPVITLSRNEKQQWNYEKLGAKSAGAQSGAPQQPPSQTQPKESGDAGVNISVSRVNLADGEIVMLSEKNKALCRLQNVDISTSVDYANAQLHGAGKAGIQTLAVADSLFLRRISGPITIVPGEVKVTPLAGKIANGEVTGEASLQLTGKPEYRLKLHIADADVDVMQQEAGARRHVIRGGKLQGDAAISGTGGLPTIAGTGKVQMLHGKLAQLPLQELIATLLQAPELREVAFDQCIMEFSITNNVMFTPVIRLTSAQVQITGNGQIALEDYSLNHTIMLALAADYIARLPKEIRASFKEQPGGFAAIEFRVWGPYDSPKTDLPQRLLKGPAEQLLQEGLRKLLK